MSQIDVLPCTTIRLRSRPAPVSMLGFGSGDARAVGLLVELHEHEVPDLDVAVGLGDRAAVGTELGPEVPEDLRRRTARAGVAHAPEVVLAEALDALGGEADRVAPDLLGLVVVLVHRDPEAVGIEPAARPCRTPTPTGSRRP